MNAEFNWWLLIVGLVAGAGLVWLVIADWSRREEDVAEDEIAAESAWIAQTMRDRGENLDPEAAEEILALHRSYLRQTGVLDSTEPTDDAVVPDPEWTDDATWTDVSVRLASPDAAAEDAAPGVGAPIATSSREDVAAESGAQPPLGEHRSVRSAPLSPRGGPAPGLESEPPKP